MPGIKEMVENIEIAEEREQVEPLAEEVALPEMDEDAVYRWIIEQLRETT